MTRSSNWHPIIVSLRLISLFAPLVAQTKIERKAKEKTKGSRRHTAEYLIAENPKQPKAIVMAFLT